MYESGTQFTTPHVERRSVFVDLIGTRVEVLERLAALDEQLERALVNPKILARRATPHPYKLADARTRADRIAELAGTPVPYEMAQLERNPRAAETIRVAEAIAKHYSDFMAVESGRISIRSVAELTFDETSNVVSCPEFPELVGRNILLAVASFIEQDFGTVVQRGERLFYICECSEFEKTPKQVGNGHNGFLGEDFIDWHVRIPHYGQTLASIFQRVHTLFTKGALDMFVVDLRGRQLYSDGKRLLRRYERDYVVPLHDAAGAYVGLNVFADVLLGDIDSERHPLAGGPYLQVVAPIAFHRSISVVKHPGYADHPLGVRDPQGRARLSNGASALDAGK